MNCYVITSYSIHYTKLYEANIIESQGAENIDYVFAHNDGMALGVTQAIKDAGLTPGVDIKIVSIDGQKEALDAILAGEWEACVQCSPIVITSYSIHYTKLYDLKINLQSAFEFYTPLEIYRVSF